MTYPSKIAEAERRLFLARQNERKMERARHLAQRAFGVAERRHNAAWFRLKKAEQAMTKLDP